MKQRYAYLAIMLVFSATVLRADVIGLSLGSSSAYAVMAGSTVTSTGTTVVTGKVGLTTAGSITGLDAAAPGTLHINDLSVQQASYDASQAFTLATELSSSEDLTGSDLGGMDLGSGVYSFASSAQLTGDLTLDGGGDSNSLFIFQVGSALTSASSASVLLTDGAQANNVYWIVGSSATLGTTTNFAGNILALQSITLDTGASLCGRAFASAGAVTLDGNTVSNGCMAAATAGGSVGDSVAATPEPGSLVLLGSGMCAMSGLFRGSRKQSRAGITG